MTMMKSCLCTFAGNIDDPLESVVQALTKVEAAEQFAKDQWDWQWGTEELDVEVRELGPKSVFTISPERSLSVKPKV